ncbi:glycosyl transferase family 2 [Novosphingobium nitrogenifigens DSM 19370]|uniref:Glycosyl transferase family 2 n=1 Tax=Novosphingobium nitrogenifigens DSM 19370 TaxID=983920 RepID=F1Z541_9SPHN|nr:glycosyltransferase [Novosphingobium nitrogenifigens]EGD60006.1 glycosyl transferase family 2 [Novosphingobium nitrogenifigens DSM 19370]
MSLAVLDLDIDHLPDRLDIEDRHDGAMVLVRLDGIPCGQAVLWNNGPGHELPLRERLLLATGSGFWERWLNRELGLPAADPMPERLPDATVVVCTRERPDDLERCLQGLLAMPGPTDILVVDNAPATDATRLVVERHPGVRYIVEPRPGLDYARNTGIAAATGEIVAFTDDDAMADPLWLRMLLTNFEDPLVMAACGLTMALELETDAQVAFQRVGGFGRGFKRIVHDGITTDPYDSWRAGAGVSIAIRRSTVALIGPFDNALGAGTRAMAGDETDFFRRLLKAGYRIAYDPRALNWHRHRRTMAELEKQMFGYECGSFAIITKGALFERDPRALAQLLRWMQGNLPWMVRSLHKRRNGKLPFNTARTLARGALAGPWRYLQARAKARRSDHARL